MINDAIFDAGLNYIKDNAENLYILNDEPTVWADIASYTVGTKTSPSFEEPAEESGVGRKLEVVSITDGELTSDDTAKYIAITDDSEELILCSGPLDTNILVYDGSLFALSGLKIVLPTNVLIVS